MEGGATDLCISMPTISMEIAGDVPSMDSIQLVSMPTISSEITNDVPTMDSMQLVSMPTTSMEITNDGLSMDSIRVDSSTSKMEGRPMNLVESEIESSKSHWSKPYNDGMSGSIQSNKEFYELLQKKWGFLFFASCDGRLSPVEKIEKIEKIAEGGQAEIFDVLHTKLDLDNVNGVVQHKFIVLLMSYYFKNPDFSSRKDGKANFVLKVFKEGFLLQDMEKQWPRGMLENLGWNPCKPGYSAQNCCHILGSILLEDGRLAFVMPKYWGDLRKAINSRMQHNSYQIRPFTTLEVGHIVVKIAWGMRELHKNKIVHGDLKASNVLVDSAPRLVGTIDPIWATFDPNETQVKHWLVSVADFECSVGVVGTSFWRAPEILQAVQDRKIEPQLFTKKVDVYGFAMTCYEVLTGMIPFQDLNKDGTQYIKVIKGMRPELPEDINLLLRTLLEKCWHGDPLERPTFKEITKSLREIYPFVYVPRKWVRTSKLRMKSCGNILYIAFGFVRFYLFLPFVFCWVILKVLLRKCWHALKP